jgi:hypothetical protein
MSASRQALAPSAGFQAARALFALPFRLLRTSLGRRIALASALTLSVNGVIGALYNSAEVPEVAAPQVAVAATAAPPRPAVSSETKAAPASVAPAKTPEAAATGWYARRHKLAANHVRALQRQAAGSGRVKVLVMADTGSSRLSTALVLVKRSGTGWTVA